MQLNEKVNLVIYILIIVYCFNLFHLHAQTIKEFTSFGFKIDRYGRERAENMNRMQKLIDKEKEVKEKKKEATAKKPKQNEGK